MKNVKWQKSNVKCKMPKVNKVKLLSERTSGVTPVIFNFGTCDELTGPPINISKRVAYKSAGATKFEIAIM